MEHKTDQSKQFKFDFNQEVQIAPNFNTDFADFREVMLEYVGNKAHIRLATHDIITGDCFYILDLPSIGGKLWWPEFALIEVS